MKITPLDAAVGASVTDIDVRQLDDADVAALDLAWAEHGLLVIRDQHLDPSEHITFASRFAEIDVNQYFVPVEGHPEIAQVKKEADEFRNIGGGWHTDHSYDQVPARGSIMCAYELPPVGGNTLFLSVGAAFDALADLTELTEDVSGALANRCPKFAGDVERLGVGRALQNALCTMSAAHSSGNIFDGPIREAVHPVVIAHPITGRSMLYVNLAFLTTFVGWSVDETRPLFELLLDHTANGGFDYALEWQPGTIGMWDNRATWHTAPNDYHGHRRLMHRITLVGDPLLAAAV